MLHSIKSNILLFAAAAFLNPIIFIDIEWSIEEIKCINLLHTVDLQSFILILKRIFSGNVCNTTYVVRTTLHVLVWTNVWCGLAWVIDGVTHDLVHTVDDFVTILSNNL